MSRHGHGCDSTRKTLLSRVQSEGGVAKRGCAARKNKNPLHLTPEAREGVARSGSAARVVQCGHMCEHR